MGQPIAVRTDFSAVEVRRLERRAKDSDQVRRLLAIAAVIDGASRAVAPPRSAGWTGRRFVTG
jgi:putative transposase